jgi:hypothetical protein
VDLAPEAKDQNNESWNGRFEKVVSAEEVTFSSIALS